MSAVACGRGQPAPASDRRALLQGSTHFKLHTARENNRSYACYAEKSASRVPFRIQVYHVWMYEGASQVPFRMKVYHVWMYEGASQVPFRIQVYHVWMYEGASQVPFHIQVYHVWMYEGASQVPFHIQVYHVWMYEGASQIPFRRRALRVGARATTSTQAASSAAVYASVCKETFLWWCAGPINSSCFHTW
jgi:hypothetical protein